MRDTSPYAATPALGYSANVISVCVLIFLGLVAFIFWLGGLAEKPVISQVGEKKAGAMGTGGADLQPAHGD
jgi:cytochrome d ubiquinol oxidase subunit I